MNSWISEEWLGMLGEGTVRRSHGDDGHQSGLANNLVAPTYAEMGGFFTTDPRLSWLTA